MYQEIKTTTLWKTKTFQFTSFMPDDWGARKGIVGIYTNKAIAIDHIIKDYYRENTDLTESELQEARQQL